MARPINEGADAVDALGGLVLGRLEVAGVILADSDVGGHPGAQTKKTWYKGSGSSWATRARPVAIRERGIGRVLVDDRQPVPAAKVSAPPPAVAKVPVDAPVL